MYNARRPGRQTAGRPGSPTDSHAVTSPFLEACELACERDQRLLFERLDMRLHPGELLQIAGPNGSGKTSLLRLLAGLMQPSAGEICLAGRALGAQRDTLARNLLWIGHAAGIKALLSAEENLAWLCALQVPASREAIWQALADIGLRGFEDVPCHTLSAGQQRRVALARLYLNPPPLWILDEPFTALDKQGVAQLEAHLAAHCEAGGMVVLTTHHTLGQRPSGYRELDLSRRSAAHE